MSRQQQQQQQQQEQEKQDDDSKFIVDYGFKLKYDLFIFFVYFFVSLRKTLRRIEKKNK